MLLKFAFTNITLIFTENYNIILSEDSVVVAFNQLMGVLEEEQRKLNQ